MNKWFKQGLLYVSLFAVFAFMVGCSLFGGLDDAEKASATFINSVFSKSDQPTAEIRYQKLISIVSTKSTSQTATMFTNPSYKSFVVTLIQKYMKSGIQKDYYIGNHPTDPQTDTRRSLVVRFPANSFKDAEALFGSNSSTNTKESYGNLILNKEGDQWKVADMKDVDESTIKKAKIDWKTVSPTDYLN